MSDIFNLLWVVSKEVVRIDRRGKRDKQCSSNTKVPSLHWFGTIYIQKIILQLLIYPIIKQTLHIQLFISISIDSLSKIIMVAREAKLNTNCTYCGWSGLVSLVVSSIIIHIFLIFSFSFLLYNLPSNF